MAASTAYSNNSSSSVSQDLDRSYAYSSIGLYFAFLGVITVVSYTLYYCTRRFRNRQRNTTSTDTDTDTVTSTEPGFALSIRVREEVEEEEATWKSYPVLLYSQAKLHRPDSATTTASACCSICLADYKDTEWLKVLPDCGHKFHRDCIDTWLRRLNFTCPICRTASSC